MIPFQDLGRLHATVRPEIDDALAKVIASSAFIGGGIREFEHAFAAAHGAAQAAGCGSGTDALVLALKATGVGPGDEVVVPSMTFVATAEAVVHAGAVPVVADVDPLSLLLTAEAVDAVRTDRTRAVIPVHLYGHVVPPATIRTWREQGMVVVEDAAQAHLATWGGDLIGSAGDAACFSFYPGKNLGAFGDGGMVMSSDAAVVERARVLRDHGRRSKYVHDEIGWCSRLDAVQAAVLSVKLRHLPSWTEQRRRLADRYRRRLDGSATPLVPWDDDGAVHHLLVVRVPGGARDAVRDALKERGVASGVHYPVPLSQQPALAPWSRSATPHADLAATEVLSLPMDPLMSHEDVDTVCDALLASTQGLGSTASASGFGAE